MLRSSTVLKGFLVKYGESKSFSTSFTKLCDGLLPNDAKQELNRQLKLFTTLKKRKDILNTKRMVLKLARADPKIERAARNRELRIPLDKVKEEWSKTRGLKEVAFLAKYYGIFRDLFDGKEFQPNTWIDIKYDNVSVHRGNIISPTVCLRKPHVTFESPSATQHTLLLVNPEGCYPHANAEVLHWMIINNSGKSNEDGESLEYLPPLPWKGSGFHRFCFVLFSQTEKLDSKELEKAKKERFEFQTRDFVSKFKGILTPVGLGWFQSEWDKSVAESAKNSGIFEPIFEWERFISPKEREMEDKRKFRSNRYRIKLTNDDILQ